MVEQTLQAIRRSALFDQIGHGIHRYATDAAWRVPHFEKMLYDQALFATVAVETFQATGDARYRAMAEQTLEYMLRDLGAPGGAFHAAEDAESEGREGAFYEWTETEVTEIAGTDAPLALAAWGIGGSTPGAALPRRAETILELAKEFEVETSAIETRLERARLALLAARSERPRPAKDRKILTDWNGLAIAALSKAGAAFDERRYTDAARNAADFILTRLRTGDGHLRHVFIGGRASVPAFLDDYAFLTEGLLDLYEASAEVKYLQAAVALEADARRLFREEATGVYFIAREGGQLPMRAVDGRDDELPAGSSAQLVNLVRLGRMTGDPGYEDRAEALTRALSGEVSRAPEAATHFLLGVDFLLGPSFEIVLAGRADDGNMAALRREVFGRFVPNKVVLHRPPGTAPPIVKLAPFTEMQRSRAGIATAYVCVDFA
ncbi:MAG: thioredoxin domain-containing protein, partial [Thermoanaerobaculia bacterium]